MKSLFVCLTFCGIMLSSCNVLELNSGVESAQGNDLIEGPDTTPSDEAQFNAFLHGTSSKVWNASGFTLVGISGFQDCRLDDSIELFVDGTYSYDGGTTLCGAEDNQTNRLGTWDLLFNQGLIQFETDTGETFQAVVTGLDIDNVVLSSTYLGLEVEASYESL